MYTFVLQTILHSKKMYWFGVILTTFSLFNVHNNLFWIHMYMVFVQKINISYSNGIPSAKHVKSCGRASRVNFFSIILHSPWHLYLHKIYFDQVHKIKWRFTLKSKNRGFIWKQIKILNHTVIFKSYIKVV